jgi:hypothetical protein
MMTLFVDEITPKRGDVHSPDTFLLWNDSGQSPLAFRGFGLSMRVRDLARKTGWIAEGL